MRHPAVSCVSLLTASVLLGGCLLDRVGVGDIDAGDATVGVDGAVPVDAGPSDCPAGTVDADGDDANGCECTLASPATETCNLADDDCDGTVDEEADQACTTMGCGGVQRCAGGMLGVCEPTASGTETCGGGDDDCDGTVDEGCACSPGEERPCGMSEGDCTEGTQTCQGDGTWGSDCVGGQGPTPEVCGGGDEDCDGFVDNDLARPCGSNMGICRTGIQTCTAGSWSDCAGGVAAMPAELCDVAGLDEDCDGASNEDCDCVLDETRACGSGACVGTQTCDITGRFGDCAVLTTGAETCNGLDDDCNGTIDDGSADCAGDTGCSVYRDRGSVYLLCQPPVSERSWADAQAYCAGYGYHLAVMNDMDEDDYVDAVTSATLSDEWWIGLADVDDDGSYEDDEWVSGTSTYRNWGGGEPDQTGQCVFLDNDDSGRWDDKGCGGSRRFVCEAD